MFADAVTGKSAVEYRKILSEDAELMVVGWPAHIPFNKPSTYGIPKLKEILAAKDEITFVGK